MTETKDCQLEERVRRLEKLLCEDGTKADFEFDFMGKRCAPVGVDGVEEGLSETLNYRWPDWNVDAVQFKQCELAVLSTGAFKLKMFVRNGSGHKNFYVDMFIVGVDATTGVELFQHDAWPGRQKKRFGAGYEEYVNSPGQSSRLAEYFNDLKAGRVLLALRGSIERYE